jgi:ferredoxin-NADP reductase
MQAQIAADEMRQREALMAVQSLRFTALLNGSENPCSYEFIKKYCVAAEDGSPALTSLLLLIVDGTVYDATLFAPTHKAGLTIIKKNVGKLDCGEVFHRIHGVNAHQLLEGLRLGTLVGAPASATSLLTVPSPANAQGRKGGVPLKRPVPQRQGCVVFQTRSVTQNTKCITFASPDRLALLPGGHVVVNAPQRDGTVVKRSYTPFEINSTSFCVVVKHYPGGMGSGYLHAVRGGEFVEMSGPVEPEVDAERLAKHSNVVLVAGGTGVAPIFSVAKYLLSPSAPGTPHVYLYACFRDEDDVLLAQELSDLQDAYPGRLDLHFVFSRADVSHFHNRVAFHGRFQERHLKHVVRNADAAVICGPPGFGESAASVLEKKLSIRSTAITIL